MERTLYLWSLILWIERRVDRLQELVMVERLW